MEGYVGKHIEFTKNVEEQEIDFDAKMRAKIVGADFHPDDSPDPYNSLGSYWKLYLDFSFWEKYNRQFMKPNFYDSNGVPCERWSDQKTYPKDGLVTIYYTPEPNKTLFNIVPLAEVEEKATAVLEKVHELIDQKHINEKGWHNTHALQEIMRVV
jgi:hypothetical protein